MKENSHRAPHWCYRSGDWTFLCTPARRLGQQEFTFFNGHYDTWCYLPLVATLTFNAEPTQYLVAAVLRPGNSPAKRGALGLLTRLFRRLRVRVITVLDGLAVAHFDGMWAA